MESKKETIADDQTEDDGSWETSLMKFKAGIITGEYGEDQGVGYYIDEIGNEISHVSFNPQSTVPENAVMVRWYNK